MCSARLTIDFPEPIHGVAPGQIAAIWYQKWCLGSGVIERTWTSDEVPARSFGEMKNEDRMLRRETKLAEEAEEGLMAA